MSMQFWFLCIAERSAQKWKETNASNNTIRYFLLITFHGKEHAAHEFFNRNVKECSASLQNFSKPYEHLTLTFLDQQCPTVADELFGPDRNLPRMVWSSVKHTRNIIPYIKRSHDSCSMRWNRRTSIKLFLRHVSWQHHVAAQRRQSAFFASSESTSDAFKYRVSQK